MADNTIVPFKPRLVTSGEDALAKGVAKCVVEEPDPCIITMLEFYLERAQAGKLRFVGLAAVDQEGIASSTWAPLDRCLAHTTQALGAVTYLSSRFIEAALAGDTFDDDDWTDDIEPA